MDNPYRCDPNYTLTDYILKSRLAFLKDWLGSLSGFRVQVLDIGESNRISRCLRYCYGLNVVNTEGDLDWSWKPTGHFHTILCLEVLEHLQNPLLFLRECKSRLYPGDTLFLTTPKASLRLLKMKDHFHEYTAEELRTILRLAGFRIVRFGTTKANYPRGIWWRGFRPFLRAMLQRSFYVEATAL